MRVHHATLYDQPLKPAGKHSQSKGEFPMVLRPEVHTDGYQGWVYAISTKVTSAGHPNASASEYKSLITGLRNPNLKIMMEFDS